ncbi:hypothetical protein ACWFPY_08510 [Nocardia fluminea]
MPALHAEAILRGVHAPSAMCRRTSSSVTAKQLQTYTGGLSGQISGWKYQAVPMFGEASLILGHRRSVCTDRQVAVVDQTDFDDPGCLDEYLVRR